MILTYVKTLVKLWVLTLVANNVLTRLDKIKI